MSDLEAFDMLSPAIRRVMWEGPQPWGAYAVFRYWQKLRKTKTPSHAENLTIAWLEDANRREILNAGRIWEVKRKVGAKPPPSPHVQARATMQTY